MNASQKLSLEKWIVGLLLAIFIISVIYSKNRINKGSGTFVTEEGAAFNLDEAKGKLFSVSHRAKAAYKPESMRDPLKKPAEVSALEKELGFAGYKEIGAGKEQKKEALVLEGIIWGGRENLAIISGNVVAEGEMANDAKVLSINKNGVILLKDGSKIELTR